MGFGLIKICTDYDYIKTVMLDDDEMWERCSNDFDKRDMNMIKNIICIWLAYYKEGKKLGLASLKFAGGIVAEIHIYIPKINRGKGTKEAGIEILEWIKENAIGQIQKINTKIPVIYKDVIRYAHSLGFKDEGIDRLSVMKSGRLIDRQNLGITFKEISLWAI